MERECEKNNLELLFCVTDVLGFSKSNCRRNEEAATNPHTHGNLQRTIDENHYRVRNIIKNDAD